MVRIIGLSDIHYASDNDILSTVLDDIKNNLLPADYLIGLGDLVHDPLQPSPTTGNSYPHQYDFDPDRVYNDLEYVLSQIDSVIGQINELYIPGNHDYWPIYLKKFGKTYWIEELDTVILAGLDSTLSYWMGAYPWKQIALLKDKIQTTGKPALIFSHHIPTSVAGITDSNDLWTAHDKYWIARNGEIVLSELDALGVKIIWLTGHIWPSSSGTATYGTNTTIAYKIHTWKWDTTNNVPLANGDTYVIDIDEVNGTINIQVFNHSSKTLTSLTSITLA